jgi:hypothetical protein
MDYHIYKICPKIAHEEGDVYYGSTKRADRFLTHKYDYNKWFVSLKMNYTSSYKVFMRYGYDNCEYVILEEGIKTKQEAMEREKYYIQTFPCVNKIYNRDIANIKVRKTRETHNELTPAQVRYRDDTEHKEKMRELSRNHKELYPHLYETHTCICGAKHLLKNVGVHLTSQKHQYFLLHGIPKPLL